VVHVLLLHEVDTAASEQPPEFVLDVNDAEPRYLPRLGLDRHVHVAVRPELIAQHRPEQRQPTEVMPSAELRDLFVVEGDPREIPVTQH